MNLTVGPHPPAVYWRRRAIVGAPLLLIVILFSSCLADGSDGNTQKPKVAAQGSKKQNDQKQPAPTPSHECTLSNPCEPEVNPSAGANPPPLGGAANPLPLTTPSNPIASKAAPIPCADDDISLTPVVAQAAYAVGSLPRFRLVIENVSDKPCTRDVGATHQELRVMAGTRRVWSSDDCSPSRGSDVRVLQPGEKRTYWLTWSAKTSSPGCPKNRTAVGPGEYQLLGRLTTATSKPVTFHFTR
jgi:hypothetical protein